jgi:transposase
LIGHEAGSARLGQDSERRLLMEASSVGVDVSKADLDVYVFPSKGRFRVANDEAGVKELIARLVHCKESVVVLEATGGFESYVAAALATAGFNVVVVNPRQVRDFARALGRLAKTDRIDSEVLALFGDRVRPAPRALPDGSHRALEALITRRRQLLEMLGAERNRLALVADRDVSKRIQRHVKWLQQELKTIDNDLDDTIRRTPMWRAKDDLLRSVPGVGQVTSDTLSAELPQLGTLRGKQAAALCGLAPFNVDSGKFVGRRQVWGGRASVRSTLYMAALVATRWNPVIRVFYHRLLRAGKPKKLALIAAARKLLVTLNAILRDQTPWRPQEA